MFDGHFARQKEREENFFFSAARPVERKCHELRNPHVWICLLSDLSSAVLILDTGVDSEAH